jgi:hypothetical protein
MDATIETGSNQRRSFAMKKILTAAIAVAVACAFTARAGDAVKEAPAKAESKPACAACPMAGAKDYKEVK